MIELGLPHFDKILRYSLYFFLFYLTVAQWSLVYQQFLQQLPV